MHEPLAGFNGFFGVFEPKPNLNFNEHDKRQGGKFVRHHMVGRSAMLVYNVSVQTITQLARTVLRVRMSSLRQLAEVCPDKALPAHLPPSHLGSMDSDVDERPLEPQRPVARPRQQGGAGRGGGAAARERGAAARGKGGGTGAAARGKGAQYGGRAGRGARARRRVEEEEEEEEEDPYSEHSEGSAEGAASEAEHEAES